MKKITGVGAVLAYAVASQLMLAGFPEAPLWIAVVASAGAIGLIVVEWSRV